MKFEKLDNWSKDFRPDGLLYFTQRIAEMLFYRTEHVFKSPVLNTPLLVEEYLTAFELTKSGTVHEKNLKCILDEFQDSFKKDIVINDHIDKNTRNSIISKINDNTQKDKKKIMEYAKILLLDYNVWCKEKLNGIIPSGGEIEDIEQVLRCYIPGLISSGYSREFISSYNKRIFSERKVESFESLSLFLNRFDFEEKKYSVFIAISLEKDDITFQKILNNFFHVEFTSSFLPELNYDENRYQLSKIEITALDEQTAAWEAYERLNDYYKFYRFLTDQKESWFHCTAKVIDEEGNQSIVQLKDMGLEYSGNKDRGRTAIESMIYLSSLQLNAEMAYKQICRALNSYNIAINDSDIRNRFLNLWSSLEILFVSEQNNTKIDVIIEKMVPILQKDYLYYLLGSIETNLQEHIEHESINNIIKQFKDDEKHDWVSFLVGLTEYSDQRNSVCEQLKDYPLIRYRILLLNDLFNNKRKLYETLNAYRTRVTWHIRRLYRTRNTIIHSGIAPDNLRELVEHIHIYSNECLLELIVLLTHYPKLESVSNVLTGVLLRVEKDMIFFQDGKTITKEDIINLFRPE